MPQQSATAVPGRILTPAFVLITSLSLMIGIIQLGFSVALPVYVISIGRTAADAGLTVGLFALAAMIGRPFWGLILDRMRKSMIYLLGALTFGAGCAMLVFPSQLDSLKYLLVARFIQGIGFSSLTTSAGAMIADILPRDRLAEGIGYYSLSGTVSNAIGPILALTVASQAGYLAMFRVQLGLTVLTILLILPLKKINPAELASIHHPEPSAAPPAAAKPDRMQRSFWLAIVEPSALPFAGLMLGLAVVVGGVQTFLPVLTTSRQLGSTGLYFAIQAGAVLAIRLFYNRLVQAYHLHHLIQFSIILIAAGMGVILVPHALAYYTSAIFYGLGFGFIYPVLNALILENCPPAKRGQANATFFLSMDLGIGAGSILLGYLARQLNTEAVFIVSVGLSLLTLGLSAPILKNHNRRVQH